MWYPNRAQWTVIWIVVPLALLIWLGSAESDDVPGRFAIALIILGAFLVWSLSKKAPSGPPPLISSNDSPARLCSKCERPVPGNAVHCVCGELQLPEEQASRLRGVRGWLAFFCFGLLVFQPLVVLSFASVALGQMGEMTSGDWLRVLPPLLLFGLTAVFGFIVAVALVGRKPRAVSWTRLYLAATLICSAGIVLWAILTLQPRDAGQLTGQLFWGSIGSFVWLSYFRKSRRVAVTFGRPELIGKTSTLQLSFVTAAAILVVGMPTFALRAAFPSIASEWSTYSPIGGGFSVELPAEPKLSNETMQEEFGAVLIHRAMVETNDTAAFAVAHFDYPPAAELLETTEALNAMREGTLAESKLKLLDSRTIFLSGYEGREIQARTSDNALGVTIRLFLVQRRVYELRAVTPVRPSVAHVNASDRFLSSFTLSPR